VIIILFNEERLLALIFTLTLTVPNKLPAEFRPVSRLVLVAVSTVGERLALVNDLFNAIDIHRHLVSGLVAVTA
jgi:hypothetical protein